MNTWNSVKVIGAVAIATLIAAAQARALVAYNYPDPGASGPLVGNQNFGSPVILGNIFTVNSDINVTAVGAFASGGSLGVTVPVAIYQLTLGTWTELTATSESFSSNTGTPIGSALFKTLNSPVLLTLGTYAIVAANYQVTGAPSWGAGYPNPNGAVPSFTSGGSLAMGDGGSPNLDYLTGNSSSSTLGATLIGPYAVTAGSSGSSFPSIGAGTFEFAPVPEAATFGAAGVGLLALVYIGRYARLRSKVTPA